MKTIVWIMWPWEKATDNDLENSYQIWKFCALQNYVTLTWWRNKWVMDSALKWAKENWWLTVWILPTNNESTFSKYIDIPIYTNMWSWRNYLNILSSNIVIACWVEAWTSSEISLAIKSQKNIILVWVSGEAKNFFNKIWWNYILLADSYVDCIKLLEDFLNKTHE